MGANVNVLQITDTRNFTLLTYAADRNFEECFQALHEHAMTYNVSENPEARYKQLKEWIDTQSVDGDTATHFASFYGNKPLLDLIVKELHADVNIKN